ncbi:hypothetical protein [Parafilimonas sp.]|uniref:hypothetical protein n=1 Tax=Parafilimonas sp. TaxID=1969739 RepID=UPI003F7ECB73
MYAGKGILINRQIGTFEDQVFFIEYTNSDIDTLSVQNLMPSPSTDCSYKIEQVKFNNLIATADASFGYQPVYVFLKQ